MALKLRAPVPFPANVAGSGGIKVSKSNGEWTIEPDYTALADIPAISDPAAKQILIFDPDTGDYNTTTLEALGEAVYEIPAAADLDMNSNDIINAQSIEFNGSSSGSTTVQASATASGTLTLPAATDTLVGKDTTDTLTNKTINASNNTVSNLTTAMFATNVVDTDGTLAANSDTRIASQKALKTYADQLIAANDAMVFKGVIDCSANPNYPAADRGHTYKVSVAGKIGGASGVNVEIGDILICLTDGTAAGNQATVGTSWTISQANIDGAVVGPTSAVSGNIATFNGTTGKLIQDGGKALPSGSIVGTSDTQALSGKTIDTASNTFKVNGTTVTTTSSILDIIGSTQGQILYRGASGWVVLSPGTSGQLLKTQGAGADPTWVTAAGTGDMLAANNLSDVANAATALANIGGAPLALSLNAQTGTTYTFVLGDAGKFCTFSNASAVTVTVPPNSSVAFPTGTRILVSQTGAGKVTLAQGSGVTINSLSSNKSLAGQYAGAVLIKTATDTWSLIGGLVP